MKLNFEVTQAHIDAGQKMVACECAVALALHDVLNTPVSVCLTSAGFYWGLDYYKAWIEGELRDFIQAFDRGEVVEPTSFSLEFLKQGDFS